MTDPNKTRGERDGEDTMVDPGMARRVEEAESEANGAPSGDEPVPRGEDDAVVISSEDLAKARGGRVPAVQVTAPEGPKGTEGLVGRIRSWLSGLFPSR